MNVIQNREKNRGKKYLRDIQTYQPKKTDNVMIKQEKLSKDK